MSDRVWIERVKKITAKTCFGGRALRGLRSRAGDRLGEGLPIPALSTIRE